MRTSCALDLVSSLLPLFRISSISYKVSDPSVVISAEGAAQEGDAQCEEDEGGEAAAREQSADPAAVAAVRVERVGRVAPLEHGALVVDHAAVAQVGGRAAWIRRRTEEEE